MVRRILFMILLLIGQNRVNAQETGQLSSSGFDTLSLQDLLNIKISVASVKALTPRQSPGIISYFSADDIRKSGARDLIDLLSTIPGFDFGVDVEGVVGLTVRGNWAHEGKVVLIIDGQEMNEGLYSTIQLGNHYPIENIEKIEIIRGPGSALYGGNAAYAVINIINRKPLSGNEIQASANYSVAQEIFGRRGANLYLGTKKNKSNISLQSNFSESNRSNHQYTDVYGASYDMKDNSRINNIFFNLGANTGNLGFRAIANHYSIESRDEYVKLLSKPNNLSFTSYQGEVNYTLKIGDKITILPKINFQHQVPWENEPLKLSGEIAPFKISSQRTSAAVTAILEATDYLNITAGAQYFYDRSEHLEPNTTFQSNENKILNYNNSSVFVQGLISSAIANIIAGFRYNDNSIFGSTIVPRVGITKEFRSFHVKALYSRSFRSPGTQNIDLSKDIIPEKTDVLEVETGYSINEYVNVVVNAYTLTTRDPIIYYFNPTTNYDAYTNSERIGTNGIELTFRYKKSRGGIDIGSSWYQSNDQSKNNPYINLMDEKEHLGISPLKINLKVHFQFLTNLTAYTSAVYLSKKSAITALDVETNNAIYSRLPETVNINFTLDYKFLKVKGFSAQLSAYNLLDQKNWFVQPYNSNHAPLPGLGREFQLKLIYQNF
ncbi:hypothetical protein BH11BAC2_BH11BAC2_00780 [soil metagenome]